MNEKYLKFKIKIDIYLPKVDENLKIYIFIDFKRKTLQNGIKYINIVDFLMNDIF